jgi:hypothetical protein
MRGSGGMFSRRLHGDEVIYEQTPIWSEDGCWACVNQFIVSDRCAPFILV